MPPSPHPENDHAPRRSSLARPSAVGGCALASVEDVDRELDRRNRGFLGVSPETVAEDASYWKPFARDTTSIRRW
jgi:hypothetical protein